MTPQNGAKTSLHCCYLPTLHVCCQKLSKKTGRVYFLGIRKVRQVAERMYLNSLLMYGNSKNRFSTYNKTPILQKPICYRRVQLLVLRHISVSFHFSTCVFLGFGLFKKTKRKKVAVLGTLLKVRQSRNDFSSRHFFQKRTNKFDFTTTLPFKMFCPFWSVWCKMALAEVGVSLP